MNPFFGVEIAIILLLIIANGFFSAAEIAIVSARHSRLQQQIDAGHKSAYKALDLAKHPERFLATVQAGITLISTLASAFGGASISEPLANWFRTVPLLRPYATTLALASVVLLITYFSLVLGELVPKRLALRFAERIAVATAPFMVRFAIVVRPVIFVLEASVNLILRLLGQSNAIKHSVTDEDIVYLTREGIASGTVEKGEGELINRVFRFTDRFISEVMTPRTSIIALDVDTPLEGVIKTFLDSGHSRLPLYQESLDNIVGVLYAKDLLRVHPAEGASDLLQLKRAPFFVSEYQHADDLMTTFRREGIHMAIVIDEYSQVSGLITLEDVLEELVGEIQDEYDAPEQSDFMQRPDGSWLVDAMVPYDSVWEKINIPEPALKEGDYRTLAGLLLAHLGRIPKAGDRVTIDNIIFEVVDMDGRRIDKVLIYPPK